MADAGIRRNDLEILKTFLSPAQESVALDIALHFEIGVEREGARGAELVHLHGVVDHEFGGKQRIDFLRIAAQLADGVAHGGEIDDGGDAGEILKQDARGHERDFFFGGAAALEGSQPARARMSSAWTKRSSSWRSKIFEQNLQREGKPRGLADAGALERVEAIDFKGVAAHGESGAGAKRVFCDGLMRVGILILSRTRGNYMKAQSEVQRRRAYSIRRRRAWVRAWKRARTLPHRRFAVWWLAAVVASE